MRAGSAQIAVAFGGLAIGAASVAIAHGSPAYSFGGDSLGYTVVGLLAGWSLVAAGILAWRFRPGRFFGPVLATAGLGWFLLEWDNPGVGSPVVFLAGLVLHAVCPPLLAHALLGYPDRAPNRFERVVLATGYTTSLLFLGLLPALVFDPAAQGCTLCPANPLTVRSLPDVLVWSHTSGLWLIIGWAVVTLALLGRRLVTATVAGRRLLMPVLLPGIIYIGLVAVAHWHGQGLPTNDPEGRLLWLAQAAALIAVATGTAAERVWRWRTRIGVTRLVVDTAHAPPGGLRDALGAVLGDSSLALLFPLADGRTVDIHGHPAARGQGQVLTELRQGDRTVALLSHRAGLLDDPGLVGELSSLARLALHTERLQAETLVQLDDLRASRARIVDIGDAERRRLERDLHDGVQQRLVTLALSIRLAHLDSGPGVDDRLEAAEREVHEALADLRNIAHGLCPAILATDGLAAALESLSEWLPVRLRIADVPDQRFDRSTELTAYLVVAETLKRSGCTEATVRASKSGERLLLTMTVRGAEVGAVVDLQDRVGAANGTLTVDGSVVRVELPCAS